MSVVAAALVAVTVLVALEGAGPAALSRHLYLAPVIVAALRFGAAGGALAAAAAVLLSAPFVLPEIERAGLTTEAIEGLVTFGVVVLVGVLGGVLRARAGRHRRRYELLVTIQRALAEEAALDVALGRLRAALASRLRVDAVAIVGRDGERLVVAGGDRVADGSLAARVLESGEAIFVGHTGGDGRARRAFGTPLMSGGHVVGVLAVERKGEISLAECATVDAVGALMGIALENARLVSRQRRFADELAQRVAEARRELEELDRAKSAFVAIASHELRTPLTALQGFSEILAVRRLPHEEVARLASVMRREARRLGRIVSDLLDLSRIERGLEPALCRIPVKIDAVIQATAEIFRQGSATHLIMTECEPALPIVDADPDALERVLTNLISNAIKYSPTGSTVCVGARAAAEGVAIEVADAGRGIPAESLSRVFEPYYRVPDAAGAARGTGIGLAVVKALVEAHGGTVHVESAPALGTRVIVVLPPAASLTPRAARV